MDFRQGGGMENTYLLEPEEKDRVSSVSFPLHFHQFSVRKSVTVTGRLLTLSILRSNPYYSSIPQR